MLAKMIFLVLTAVILIHGNGVNAIDEALKAYIDVSVKCAPDTHRDTYGLCIMRGHGVIDDKGNWDKKKLEDVIRVSYAGSESPPGMIAQSAQCVDEATGATVENKVTQFLDCMAKKPDIVRKIF